MKATILLLLLTIPVVSAQLVYDGWVLNGDDVAIGRSSYSLHFLSEERLYAERGDSILELANNSCSQDEFAKLCVDDTTFDSTARRFKAKIRAYETAPHVTITRSIDDEQPMIGGYTTVTVTLSNDGDNIAQDALYVDDFGEGVTVDDPEGVTVVGSKATWQGGLGKGTTRTMSYQVYPTQLTDRRLKASLTYFDGFENTTLYSSEIHLAPRPFLSLVVSSGPQTIELGTVSNITMNLTNAYAHATQIDSLEIIFPQSVKIISSPTSMARSNQTYSWNGTVAANTSSFYRVFPFSFKAIRPGKASIVMLGHYTDNLGVGRDIPLVKTDLDITFDAAMVLTTNLKDGETFESFQRNELKVWAEDVNTGMNLTNAKISYVSTLPISNITIPLIETQDQKKILDQEFTMPDLNSSITGVLDIVADYTTPYGDRKSTKLSRRFTIQPIRPLILEQRVDDTDLEGDQETTVHVSILNQRTVDISYVNVTDSTDLPVHGTPAVVIDINQGDRMSAYTYTIRAPRLQSVQFYNVTTTASYRDNRSAYAYSQTIPITVRPKKPIISVRRELIDSDVHRGEVVATRYTVTDDDSEAVYNLRLGFPLQPETDILGSLETAAAVLEPGESWTVVDDGRFRIKLNGSVRLAKPALAFSDAYGNTFEVNGTETDLSVTPGYGPGPIVLVTRNTSSPLRGQRVRLTYTLTNTGDTETTANLSDLGREWSIRLPPLAASTVFQDQMVEGRISGARVSYPCLEHVCTTISAPSIITPRDAIPTPEIQPDVLSPESENRTDDRPALVRSLEKAPVSIWEGIKRFLRSVFPR